MRLSGRTILVTRAEQQSAELTELIELEGGSALVFPMIHISGPETWAVCDQLQDKMSDYDGIFFTSSNAVTGFLDRYWERCGSIDSMRKLSVYAVGEKTADRIRRYGLEVAGMPEQFTANDLVATLSPDAIDGKRFIFPRGNLGSDVIAKHILTHGGDLDEVVVYRTLPPEQRDVENIQRHLHSGSVDAITFTSPSTARNFFHAVPDFPVTGPRPVIASIGPVTASALEKLGFPADVTASPSTIEGLVEALAARFTPGRTGHFS